VEVERTYARARALCAQLGQTPQLFPTLQGLCEFYRNRGALYTSQELGEQLCQLAQRQDEASLRLEAHVALGTTLFHLGEYAAGWAHLEQGLALIDPMAQRVLALRHGVAPGVRCLALAANTLWCLGFPAQARRRSAEALALAQAMAHPYSQALAQHFAAFLHHRRREASAVQTCAETLLMLATAHGFRLYVGYGTCYQGWALAAQGQGEAGLAQIRRGLSHLMATGLELSRPLWFVLLAEVAGRVDPVGEGRRLLAEALTAFETSERGDMRAEAYRLQGEWLLRQAEGSASQAARRTEAEMCFRQALTLARHQQAKALGAAGGTEPESAVAATRQEARQLLAEVYAWFSEGFDTADLRETQGLLEALA
jgi:tetratricopeptide (TPR) repeat protein